MARSNVVCQGKHTALYKKNSIRGEWMWETPRHKDIITISHGALDTLNLLRWQGKVYVCDIDPGVVESATYMWEDGSFPHLKLHKPILVPVQHLVELYSRSHQGTTELGAVDMDLANCIDSCHSDLQLTLQVLKTYRVRTKVLLTFRNGRDVFKCVNDRLEWLRDNLPRGTRYVKHTEYTSSSTREDASRDKGSAMCLVEIAT